MCLRCFAVGTSSARWRVRCVEAPGPEVPRSNAAGVGAAALVGRVMASLRWGCLIGSVTAPNLPSSLGSPNRRWTWPAQRNLLRIAVFSVHDVCKIGHIFVSRWARSCRPNCAISRSGPHFASSFKERGVPPPGPKTLKHGY